MTITNLRQCVGCGCTDDNACMTIDGPCHWAAEDLCSACAEISPAENERPILCAHSFLYVDTITAKCVRCGEVKIDREAA